MPLTLIGLGVKAGDISVAAAEKIRQADLVMLKTDKTENFSFFADNGIAVTTMDGLYKKSRNFDTLCKNVAAEVYSLSKNKNAVYCVDGSVAEDNACKLILSKHAEVNVISGVSKVSACMEKVGLRGGYSAVSAYDAEEFTYSSAPVCIYDLDSVFLAGQIKLKLMDVYGEECPCIAFYGNEKVNISLYEADRLPRYDYTTFLVVTPRDFLNKDAYDYNDLLKLIQTLRDENGCPWDRAQTHESIRINAIEEIYEMVDAIDRSDDERLTEEIGDVLMQAVFHTILGEERGALTRGEVLTGVCKKLINRHTHIFFGDKADDAKEALDVWDKNKQKEHGFTAKQSVADVAECFPALLRTEKVQKRAVKAGWQCGDKLQTEQKITELATQLIDCSDENAAKQIGGELLFDCVNLLRLSGVECEIALKDKTADFVKEFTEGD